MKKLLSTTFVLLLLITSSITALASEVAAPTVTFDGTKQEFSYANTAEHMDAEGNTRPDLFVNFKNVIPGDEITQDIQVEIKNVKKTDTVKVYLQAKAMDDTYVALLESINITVNQGDKDITADLSKPVLLGSFKADEVVDMSVELGVPITVGNEIQSLTATTDWVFTAEIIPDSNKPKTGDTTNVALFVILAIVACGGAAFVMKRRHK